MSTEAAYTYISDLIQTGDSFSPHCLNLIAAGCGAGKSYFVARHLPKLFPTINPCDMLFVTSRSITVDQQAREYQGSVLKYDPEDKAMIKHWTQMCPVEPDMHPECMRLMTFDKLIDLITRHRHPEYSILEGVRIVVVDECHALLSDTFIRGIDSISTWMKMAMRLQDTIMIGLTATPDILRASEEWHGFPIKQVLDEPLTLYKANRLWLVDESEVLSVLRDGTLQGKTIVMGDSRDRMAKMAAEVPNSAVLISQHANGYTQQMERVRETIVQEGVLGPKVDVLFATTTLREGVTLRPESGVRNVVTFLPDELHVSQFLGRCRFDVENLVVVYAKSVVGRSGEVSYIDSQRQNFADFAFFRNTGWFSSVQHLVRGGLRDVQRYHWHGGMRGFDEYLNNRWAVDDADSAPAEKFIRKENQSELIEQAAQNGVFDEMRCEHRYINVKRYVNKHPRLRMVDKRIQKDGERFSCNVIERKPETKEEANP